MRGKDKDPHPLGICQRLFNFIVNSLFVPGIKRVTAGRPVPTPRLNEVPVEISSENGEQREPDAEPTKADNSLSSDIVIELRHTDGSDNGRIRVEDGQMPTVKDEHGSRNKETDLVVAGETPLSSEKVKEQNSKKSEGGGGKGRPVKPENTKDSSAVEITEEKEKNNIRKKEAGDEDRRTTASSDHNLHDHEKRKIAAAGTERNGIIRSHLFSVVSNINEKTEAFIRRKKEAMQK